MSIASATDLLIASEAVDDVFETSEARWFAEGLMPPSVIAWFTTGLVGLEVRCDRYFVNGATDVGLKRRDGGPLELKVLLGSGDRLALDGDTHGLIEDWRKLTSPSGDCFAGYDRGVPLDVHKIILNRSHTRRDGILRPTAERDLSRPGCDVELASVTVGEVAGWTFAFEAWGGGEAERRRNLRETWAAFRTETPLPDTLTARLTADHAYPAWLAALAPAEHI